MVVCCIVGLCVGLGLGCVFVKWFVCWIGLGWVLDCV